MSRKVEAHDCLECWPITTLAELGNSTRELAPDCLCLSARVLAELWQSILMVAHSCLGWPLYQNSNEGAGPCLPSTRVLAPDCLCRALGQRFWPLSFTRVLGPRSSTRAPVLDRSSRALEFHKGGGPRLSKQSSRAPQGCRPSIVRAEL